MSETRKATAEPLPFVAPCRRLPPLAALGWLRRAWADYRAAAGLSLAYGLFVALLSLAASWVAFRFGSYWLLLAALSGFVFLGPVLCLGLYAISAQLERGQRPRLAVSLQEAAVRRVGTEMVFALMLLVVFLVWARAGSMVHVFFPVEAEPDLGALASYLGVGTVVGAVFAAITFAASAFSLPMLMHRDVDAVTAVVTSINAVLRNKPAMAVWAAVILLAVLIGFLTAFIGFVITIPLIGYATWHAYQATIDASSFPRHAEGVTDRPRPDKLSFDI